MVFSIVRYRRILLLPNGSYLKKKWWSIKNFLSNLPTNSPQIILMATGDTRLICVVLIFLLIVAHRGQCNLILLAANFIFGTHFLNAVRVTEVLVLILSTGAQFLDDINNSSIYTSKHHLFALLHANFCVIIDAFYAGSQLTATNWYAWRCLL